LKLEKIYPILLSVIAIAIGPVIFLTPFLLAEPANPAYDTYILKLNDLGAPILARVFIIMGFAISLLTILNFFETIFAKTKVTYRLYRIIRVITFLGCLLGVLGSLLVISILLRMRTDLTYASVSLGSGFYVSVILFGLVFLGFVILWVKEEKTYQKNKLEKHFPIDNP